MTGSINYHDGRLLKFSMLFLAKSLTAECLITMGDCSVQGGHSPGKPGEVGEFKSGQGKVRENVFFMHEICPLGCQEN